MRSVRLAFLLAAALFGFLSQREIRPADPKEINTTSSGAFKFVVVGDTQSANGVDAYNLNVLPQLVADMNAQQPDFGIFCGDLVAGTSTVGGTTAQWEQWKQATAGFVGTRYAVPGNHDFYGGNGTMSAWQATFPWLPTHNSPSGEEGLSYYFDVGNSRFISVLTDSINGQVPVTQQAWLDGVLANSAQMEHVFVFSHHPVSFSQAEVLGGTGGSFWQSLVQNDVDAYFSGHWHRYQPSQLGAGGNTWEVIIGTGGGWQGFDPIRPYQQIHGFLLVEVSGLEAVATFYGDADQDGSYDDPLDSFVIRSSTPAPRGLVAYYNFEDGTARDWAPLPMGRGIHGELKGGTTIVGNTPTGHSLSLNGNSDYVEAGSIADYVLSINGDLTLALHAKFDSLDSGMWSNTFLTYATNDYYTEDEETNYSYWLSLQNDKDLVSFWEHDDGVNVTLTSTQPAPVNNNEWHHYALVREAQTQQVLFYVDGQQLGNAVSYSRNPTGGGRGMLYIGSDVLGATPMDGMIDEVRIYNRALSASEILELATQPNLSVANLTAGSTATLSIHQATPLSPVVFAYSLSGGGPVNTPVGTVLLTPPIYPIPGIQTDGLGFANSTGSVPASLTGAPIWLQCLDQGSGTLSNGWMDRIR